MSSAAGSDQVQRAEVSYQPLYQRFLIKDRDYKKQYSHIYTRRLAALRPVVLRSAEERWGGQSGMCTQLCCIVLHEDVCQQLSGSLIRLQGGSMCAQR